MTPMETDILDKIAELMGSDGFRNVEVVEATGSGKEVLFEYEGYMFSLQLERI
jgi:hypothetical protein